MRLDSLALVLDTQVDDALSTLRRDAGSAEWAGLAVTGDGGVGKSALAGQVLRRLAAEGWAVGAHYGRWLPTELFYAVAQAVNESPDDFPNRAEVLRELTGRGTDLTKFDVVCDLLARSPLALVFDDFGPNLVDGGEGDGGGSFLDPGFAALFHRLGAAADRGRILVTSRLRLPASTRLPELHIGPLEPADALRLASRFPRLGTLDQPQLSTIVTRLCGHPRLLALADTWLAVGVGDGALALEMLTGLLPDLPRPDGAGPYQMARYQQAVVPILRAVLLTMHTQALPGPVLDMLLQAAVSTVPLTARDLAVACDRRDLTAEQRRSPDAEDVRAAEDAGYRLAPLGLASPAADWEIFVGPWIADGLAGQQGEELSERHERAIQMHYAELGGERSSYTHIAAITRNLVAVGGWDDLVNFAYDISGLTVDGNRSNWLPDAALLGEVVPAVPTDHPNLPRLVERQIVILEHLGLHEAAREVGRRFGSTVAAWARSRGVALDAEPVDLDGADVQRQDAVAAAYDRLGDAARLAGNVTDAGTAYLRCLAIRMRRFEAAPTPATYRALTPLVERLAGMLREVGNLASARRLHATLVLAAEALVRAFPGDEEIARDHHRAVESLEHFDASPAGTASGASPAGTASGASPAGTASGASPAGTAPST